MIAVLGWSLVIVVALIAWFCYAAIFRGAKAIFGIGRDPKEEPVDTELVVEAQPTTDPETSTFLERYKRLKALSVPFMDDPKAGDACPPFSHGPYVCNIHYDLTEDGEVFEKERYWYADTRAVEEVDEFLRSLPALPEEIGGGTIPFPKATPADELPETFDGLPMACLRLYRRTPRAQWRLSLYDPNAETGSTIISYVRGEPNRVHSYTWQDHKGLETVYLRKDGEMRLEKASVKPSIEEPWLQIYKAQ